MAENNMTPESTPQGDNQQGTTSYPQIDIQNSFTLTGEDIERMRKTKVEPAGNGSQLDNLGAHVTLSTEPEKIAADPHMSVEEKRKRIEFLTIPFDKFMANVLKNLRGRPEAQKTEIIAAVRDKKGVILELNGIKPGSLQEEE